MNRIRELREAHNFTQDFVAEAIDVSRITYVRYENDSRPMKAPELIRLATLYHVSVDYLLGLSDVPQPEGVPIQPYETTEASGSTAPSMPKNIEELSDLIRKIVSSMPDNKPDKPSSV